MNPRSIRNFPMQANGAEMLRIALMLALERGVKVLCPSWSRSFSTRRACPNGLPLRVSRNSWLGGAWRTKLGEIYIIRINLKAEVEVRLKALANDIRHKQKRTHPHIARTVKIVLITTRQQQVQPDGRAALVRLQKG